MLYFSRFMLPFFFPRYLGTAAHAILPYLVPLFLNSDRSFFVQLFPPVCLTAASSVISYHQLFLLLHVVSLSLRFVKETIMVRREEKLVSILPMSARHSMVSVYSSPHGGEQEGGQGEWTERSPRPS